MCACAAFCTCCSLAAAGKYGRNAGSEGDVLSKVRRFSPLPPSSPLLRSFPLRSSSIHTLLCSSLLSIPAIPALFCFRASLISHISSLLPSIPSLSLFSLRCSSLHSISLHTSLHFSALRFSSLHTSFSYSFLSIHLLFAPSLPSSAFSPLSLSLSLSVILFLSLFLHLLTASLAVLLINRSSLRNLQE